MTISKQTILLLSLICISKFSIAQFTGTNPIQQASAGNVAIGFPAYTPLSLLQVKNGSVLFDGTTGATPISGSGTRMMWVPAKWAFRAGYVNSTQWDAANNGEYSFAFGANPIASGALSFAVGLNCIASGTSSFSLGTANNAQSYSSFVIGQYNVTNPSYNGGTWVNTDPLFVIGNGNPTPSNALTVLKNGNTGISIPNPMAKLDIYEPRTTTPLNTALKVGAYMNNPNSGTITS